MRVGDPGLCMGSRSAVGDVRVVVVVGSGSDFALRLDDSTMH